MVLYAGGHEGQAPMKLPEAASTTLAVPMQQDFNEDNTAESRV